MMDPYGAQEARARNLITQPRDMSTNDPSLGNITSTPRHRQVPKIMTARSDSYALYSSPSIPQSKLSQHETQPSPRTPRMLPPRHSQPSNSRSASRIQQEKHASHHLHTNLLPQILPATLRRTQNVMKQPACSIPILRPVSPSLFSSPFLAGLVSIQEQQQFDQQQQQHLSEKQMLLAADPLPSWMSISAWWVPGPDARTYTYM